MTRLLFRRGDTLQPTPEPGMGFWSELLINTLPALVAGVFAPRSGGGKPAEKPGQEEAVVIHTLRCVRCGIESVRESAGSKPCPTDSCRGRLYVRSSSYSLPGERTRDWAGNCFSLAIFSGAVMLFGFFWALVAPPTRARSSEENAGLGAIIFGLGAFGVALGSALAAGLWIVAKLVEMASRQRTAG